MTLPSIVPFARRPYDWFFVAYFIMHIPLTLICDAQIVFPREYFPSFAVNAMQDWIRDFDDQLARTKPLWFQAFVVVELLFHVPYFFVAAAAFYRGDNRIRTISIVYATAVIASMIPILPEAWVQSTAPLNVKIPCISIYGLWLLIPILLLQRVWNERVFDYETVPASDKKQQ